MVTNQWRGSVIRRWAVAAFHPPFCSPSEIERWAFSRAKDARLFLLSRKKPWKLRGGIYTHVVPFHLCMISCLGMGQNWEPGGPLVIQSCFLVNHWNCGIQFWSVHLSAWWFETCFIFPYIGNNHPFWLSCFSDGWLNHQPVLAVISFGYCNSPRINAGGAAHLSPIWPALQLLFGTPPAGRSSASPTHGVKGKGFHGQTMWDYPMIIPLSLNLYMYIYNYVYIYITYYLWFFYVHIQAMCIERERVDLHAYWEFVPLDHISPCRWYCQLVATSLAEVSIKSP